MCRVLVGALVGMLVTGCGLSTSALNTGVTEPPADRTAGMARNAPSRRGIGGDVDTRSPTAVSRGPRTASLDRGAAGPAPEKAPKGALSDRDYSKARLDPEAARDLINAYRKTKGLKPLKLDAELTAAARGHAADLAKWDRISHYGSDGSSPWDRVKRAGYKAKLAAENVGTGQATFDEVLRGWQESAGHNKNLLLADANHMGIALIHDPKTEFKTFWALVVGSRL